MRVLFSGAPLYGHLMPLLPLARALVRRGDEVAFAVPPSLAPVLASEDVEIFPAGAEPLAIRAEILRRIGVNTATGPTADSDCEAFAGAGLDLAVEQVLAVAQEWRPDLVIGDVFSYTTLLVAACVHVPAAHVTLRHEVGEFEHALRAMAAKRFEARGLTFRPPSWVLDICPSDLQVPGWRKPPGWMPMRPQAHTAPGGVTRTPHHGERPQLLVTFGTAFSDPTLVDPIVRELTALDVDLRVTVGPTAAPEDFNTDSGRIVFERFTPLADLLLGVDLVVAHGGAGTTLGALAAGIPLVLAPQGADQFVVTERAVAAGAAASVLPGPAVPSEIATAVRTVLTERRFRDEGDEKLLAVAEEVEGFFVPPDKHHGEVAILNVRVSAHAPKRTDDAILYIINSQQETIGEYFIGRVVFGSGEVNYWSGNKSRFEFRFFGNRCEVPGTGEIWRRWASGVPVRKGEWLDLSLDQQESWLHVVQNSWFTTGHRAGRYGDDDIVHLDGAQISTKTGFYCALGEAVNGPGGYFGSNLDALVDCIRSSPAHKSLIGIRWDDFAASREALGIEFIDAVMGVMHEFGVEVTCL